MRKHLFTVIVLTVVFMINGIANADQQYRSGVAPVMEPTPRAPKPDVDRVEFEEIRRAFAATYVAAGQPRIALFWNMALSEDVSDNKVSRTSLQGGSTRNWNGIDKITSGEAESATLRDGEEKRANKMTMTSEDLITNKDKRKASLAESDAWKLETAFAGALHTANMRFTDRSTIMRMAHVQQGKDATSDMHTIEATALQGKADMFMEVLITKDSKAPLGWGFLVSLKDVKSGTQLVTFYSAAVPHYGAAPEPYFVATNKGFQKVTPPVVNATVADVGRALARDTMRELQNALSANQEHASR